jgi:hypothetical protein
MLSRATEFFFILLKTPSQTTAFSHEEVYVSLKGVEHVLALQQQSFLEPVPEQVVRAPL